MTLSDVMNGICNDPYQDNTANMTKALTATAFPKWRGEVDPSTNLEHSALTTDHFCSLRECSLHELHGSLKIQVVMMV